jgi:hypothetical protein
MSSDEYIRRPTMVYAFTQDVPIDEPTYRKIMDRLGPEPIKGSLLHLAVRRPEGGLRYIDVWESEESCESAFSDRIHPAVYGVFKELGFRPEGEPPVTHLDVIDASGSLLTQ